MPLTRVDAICRVLKTDFAELARQVAEAQAQRHMRTPAQEVAVVADPRLLLLALCVLSQWTAAQTVATHRISEADCVAGLARLDRLGLFELRAGNRDRARGQDPALATRRAGGGSHAARCPAWRLTMPRHPPTVSGARHDAQ